jgi:hypothetical protein
MLLVKVSGFPVSQLKTGGPSSKGVEEECRPSSLVCRAIYWSSAMLRCCDAAMPQRSQRRWPHDRPFALATCGVAAPPPENKPKYSPRQAQLNSTTAAGTPLARWAGDGGHAVSTWALGVLSLTRAPPVVRQIFEESIARVCAPYWAPSVDAANGRPRAFPPVVARRGRP